MYGCFCKERLQRWEKLYSGHSKKILLFVALILSGEQVVLSKVVYDRYSIYTVGMVGMTICFYHQQRDFVAVHSPRDNLESPEYL